MTDINAEQAEFWSDQAGPKWVRLGQDMDRLLAPVLNRVLEIADLRAGDTVLDIGCGGGTSTFACAQAIGPTGLAVGADISTTLLAQAQMRASENAEKNAAFVQADAQTERFADAPFDVMVSRFGVMFFADPAAAFRNIATALNPGGRMVFAAWGQIPANPYFTLPAAVCREVFGAAPPKTDPDEPGPFAFRNPARVTDILTQAGLRDIKVRVEQIALTPPGGIEGMAALCLEIGPAERAFAYFDADAVAREKVLSGIKSALQPHVTDGVLRIPAEINFVTARAR